MKILTIIALVILIAGYVLGAILYAGMTDRKPGRVKDLFMIIFYPLFIWFEK